MHNEFKKVFLSLFFSGFLPKAPGTWGSLVSLFLIIMIREILPENIFLKSLIVAVLFFAVYFFSVKFIKELTSNDKHDEQWIVIDEFLGMVIACLPYFFLAGRNWQLLLVGFLLFRIFDISKFWVIKKIDRMKSVQAVLLDDVMAGIFTLAVLLVLCFFLI